MQNNTVKFEEMNQKLTNIQNNTQYEKTIIWQLIEDFIFIAKSHSRGVKGITNLTYLLDQNKGQDFKDFQKHLRKCK